MSAETSGLAQILSALATIEQRLGDNQAEVRRLHDRLDAMEAGLAAVVRDAVRDALADLDLPSSTDHVQAIIATALSVLPAPKVDEEAVASIVRESVATTAPVVDLQPVLDAIHAHEPTIDVMPIVDAVRSGVAQLGARFDAAGFDAEHVAAAVLAGLDDASLTSEGDGSASDLSVVRRTVAASHRALLTQLRTMLDEYRTAVRTDTSQELDERRVGERSPGEHLIEAAARDIEAVRRAIERAGGETR